MAPAPKFSPEQQEKMILDAAANCIQESSVMDFTMSAVAKAAGLSMGSVYKHVQCKEDIILALAHLSSTHQSSVFRQVLQLDLSPAETIIGISLLNPTKNQLYDFDCELHSFACSEAVIKRASVAWTDRMLQANENCASQFTQLFEQAAADGHFLENEDLPSLISELNLGAWALMVGFHEVQRHMQFKQISEGTDTLREPQQLDSPALKNLIRLVNSYPWKQPLKLASLPIIEAKLTELNIR